MKIRDLIKDLPCTVIQGDLDTEVTGICHDNRLLKKGDAFLCIAGARFDTHEIAGEIARSGAALIVAEKEVAVPKYTAVIRVEDTRKASPYLAAAFYGNPASHLLTVGITGSKGKTTTTHMLADIFRKAGYLTGTIGTNGAILPKKAESKEEREYLYRDIPGACEEDPIDCKETPGYDCYELSNTTPDAMEIQRYLAMMVKAGCTHVVIEVSSQGMKQHRTDGFVFDYSIWTNIETGDHIGPNEHKDFEEYEACKAMLLNQSRTAFINCDDSHIDSFLTFVNEPGKAAYPLKRYFYGRSEKADYRALDLRKTKDEASGNPGIAFRVDGRFQAAVSVNLPGDFNELNALAAVCVASDLSISEQAINEALTHLKIRGRFDIVYDNGHFKVCVDFAHNGYSTRNHLKALREYEPKRLICVFGADGNRSKYRRYEMGEASAMLADVSIVTAGHNRYETFDAILADIEKGIRVAKEHRTEPVNYLVIPNRKEAIRYAVNHAKDGDMITIIGLGHESYQEENGVKYPHSDIDFARKCCEEREQRDRK